MHAPDSDEALATEQQYLDQARVALAAMQQRADRNLAFGTRAAREERTVDARITEWHLARRRAALEVDAAALCFGRIDADTHERHYIGRRHVEDPTGEPLVVDWRAPVAMPFYRATAADPCGLVRRRRFTLEGHRLVAIFDEALDDPDAAAGSGLPDPVLAQIERRRTGAMGDIVATIAAEQDVIIRAPLEELLVVQGGPGTGKTAVALHRAAFLLFEHRERLNREKVLVIGPNRVFLRYIADVLPSLGETAVRQATIETLLEASFPVTRDDPPEVAALKGDVRMATVLERLARGRLSLPAEPVRLPVGVRSVSLDPDAIADAQATALSRQLPMNEARSVYRELLVRAAWQALTRRGADPAEEPLAVSELRRRSELRQLVDRTWPSLGAPALVRSLLGNRRLRRAAADGVLDAAEQALLQRPPAPASAGVSWSAADIPLLDEAGALTGGTAVRYGHVVVDEAQDLSAMALRMAARRARLGSMTVLGDLAQATAPGALASWERAVPVLAAASAAAAGASPVARRADLTVGYRVPGPILDLANRLLPQAAPHVTPPVAIRSRGEAPLVVSRPDLATGAADEVEALAERWGTVGVIAVPQHLPVIATELAARGISAATATAGQGQGLGEPVVLIDCTAVKGLEFDAVVVVEPAAIADLTGGLRLLYIALTRAVQHLGVVHHRPLPWDAA